MYRFSVLVLLVCSTLHFGCSSGTLDSADADSPTAAGPVEQLTKLDGLVVAVKSAIESREVDRVQELFYTENQPEELAEILHSQFTFFFDHDEVVVKRINTVAFSDHVPDMELPGEINGRKLVFIEPPSHWVIVNLSGKNLSPEKHTNVELTFPAAEVGGIWMLLGSRYEQK